MFDMEQKPEKNMKKVRLRNKALDSLIPFDAKNVFRRPSPDMCWIDEGRIDVLDHPIFDVCPLLDPNLFLSFVRLGARRGGEYKHPSENRIKKWVEKYGLPKKNLPTRDMPEPEIISLSVTKNSMPVEQFRRGVRDAWELWTIHKEVWSEDSEAIMERVKTPRSRWDRELVEGFESRDHRDRRKVARILYRAPSTAIIGTAHDVLD